MINNEISFHVEHDETHPFEDLFFNTTVYDISKNDEIIAMANDKWVKIFDVQSFKELVSITVEDESCTSVLIYKDWIIFSAGITIYFYDRFNYKQVKKQIIPKDERYSSVWNIKLLNEKIYFPSNLGIVMIYDVKKDTFTSFEVKEECFTVVDVYRDTLYIISNKILYIMDVENHEKNQKEIEMDYCTQGIATNHSNIFISDDTGIIHVYNHEYQELKSIEFKEGKMSVWLSLVNHYLFSGSTWGSDKHVLIYDLLKNEKYVISNLENYGIWCVKPFEDLNQIFLGHDSGIKVYNCNMSKQKYIFTGKINIFSNLHFKFH